VSSSHVREAGCETFLGTRVLFRSGPPTKSTSPEHSKMLQMEKKCIRVVVIFASNDDERRRQRTMERDDDDGFGSGFGSGDASSSSSVVNLGDGFDDAFDDEAASTTSADRCVQPSPRHQLQLEHHRVRCDADALLDVAWRIAVRTTVTEERFLSSASFTSLEEVFERVDAVAETLALEALGRRLGDGCAGESPAPLRLVSPGRDDDDRGGDEENFRRRLRDAILDAKDAKELALESLAFGDFEEARERMLRWRALCDEAAPARAFALLAATTFGTEKVLVEGSQRGGTVRVASASCIDELDAYASRKRQRREALRELTHLSTDEQPNDVQAAARRGRVTKSPLGSPSRASTWRDTAVKIAVTERIGQENESPRGV